MTDQERQLIEALASRIHNAPAPQIDREADDVIRRSIGTRPDALYILTQTVLIQEMALNQAKQQIEDLKNQQPAQPPASFLGGATGAGWGRDSRVQQPAPAGGYQGSSYQTGSAPQQPPPLPQYAQPQYAAPPSGGRFSGFLQSAAQTAAGVVAGEVAFSALSSLFGHHGDSYGGSGFFGGGSGVSPVSETIINNNYYEEGDRDRDRGEERFASDRSDSGDDATDYQDDNVSDDSSDVDDSSSDDDGSTDV